MIDVAKTTVKVRRIIFLLHYYSQICILPIWVITVLTIILNGFAPVLAPFAVTIFILSFIISYLFILTRQRQRYELIFSLELLKNSIYRNNKDLNQEFLLVNNKLKNIKDEYSYYKLLWSSFEKYFNNVNTGIEKIYSAYVSCSLKRDKSIAILNKIIQAFGKGSIDYIEDLENFIKDFPSPKRIETTSLFFAGIKIVPDVILRIVSKIKTNKFIMDVYHKSYDYSIELLAKVIPIILLTALVYLVFKFIFHINVEDYLWKIFLKWMGS